ncbi:MAG: polysaccharide deacetylase family protein [Elusimicrobia bacterium]|nr:polysaccharide deacetylase family protein [Elusimicrobiota bacterium]
MKSILLKTAFALGLDRPLRWLRRRQAVVLMYHGFTDRPSDGIVNYQGNRLQQASFRRQLAFLKENCAVVTLRQVAASLSGGPALPDYAVALTIDDGYESVYALGFPALREAKLPATLFVATQFVDERAPLWPDRLEYAFAGAPGDPAARRERLKGLQRRAKDLLPAEREALIAPVEAELGRKLILDSSAPENYRPLTWAQAREMADSGLMEIGSHTHTHTIVTLPGEEEGRRELALSKTLVEKNVGRPCDLFCYPNGDYDDFSPATTKLLRESGFLCGLTTVAGFVRPGDDPYTMLRFGTDDRDSFEKFRMTFSLGRNLLQGARRRLS